MCNVKIVKTNSIQKSSNSSIFLGSSHIGFQIGLKFIKGYISSSHDHYTGEYFVSLKYDILFKKRVKKV